MVNWNDPVSTGGYLSILDDLRQRDKDAITFLEGSSSTNLPMGAKRWDSGKFQTWDGSAWGDLSALYQINVRYLGGKELGDLVLADAVGAANGIASLGADTRIPAAQIGAIDLGNNPAATYHLQLKRLTGIQLSTYAGATGELVINTSTGRPYLMNGALAGGLALAFLSDIQNLSGTSLTLSGDCTVGGQLKVGSPTQGFFINGSNISYGTSAAENAENWNRVFDLLGAANAKFSLRTVAGLYAGFWVADSTSPWADAFGAIYGTRSAHPVSVIVNGVLRLFIKANGKIGTNGVTDPQYEQDLGGTTRVSRLILQSDRNDPNAGTNQIVLHRNGQAGEMRMDIDSDGSINLVGVDQLQVGGRSLTDLKRGEVFAWLECTLTNYNAGVFGTYLTVHNSENLQATGVAWTGGFNPIGANGAIDILFQTPIGDTGYYAELVQSEFLKATNPSDPAALVYTNGDTYFQGGNPKDFVNTKNTANTYFYRAFTWGRKQVSGCRIGLPVRILAPNDYTVNNTIWSTKCVVFFRKL